MKRRTLLAALAGVSCAKKNPLPEMGVVPPFQLIDHTGAPFDSARLTGRIWVANFMFTSCQATCPRQSTVLSRMQRETTADLVSFTVDVARDTPAVLAAYAQRYQADTKRWHFLTGNPATLDQLAYQVFQVGNVTGSLDHSSRLLLVDARGHYRGSYPTTGEESIARLVADIKELTKEK